MFSHPLYKRILLKLSGEALMGEAGFGIDPKVLDRIAREVGVLISKKVQVALVIGGGNLFRGAALSESGLGRVTGDHMGMLATMMNALALRDAMERNNLPTRIMSAIPMGGVVDHYDRRKVLHHLNAGGVVIFSAGTGNPFFTTDSAASLRGIEIDADIVLKATKVEGVYDSDPVINPSAKMFSKLTFDDVITKKLRVMDMTAISMCRDYNMPIKVFSMIKEHSLVDVVFDNTIGTLVEAE